MTVEIAGSAAVVTGAASGLGAATAEHLVKAGAKVALLDINLDSASETANRIGGLPRPWRWRASATAPPAS
jgi:NAD(P)-dependent dehydrogenase (short-subunit alcohol dehydrogenase family)